MPRTKTVELNDQSFKIASLTLEKAEEYFPNPAPARTAEQIMQLMKDVVCFSLNAAGATPLWTPERIHKEMDLQLFKWLYIQIREMSGLQLVPAGEVPAAN